MLLFACGGDSGKGPPGAKAAAPRDQHKDHPGYNLFIANCVRCHHPGLTVASTGPALTGMMDRVPSREWLQRWIRNSDELIREGNPYAVHIFEKNGKAKMDPNPNLTVAQINDIIDWIILCDVKE